jgi:geranylgeranyl pyrophosphate synthase
MKVLRSNSMHTEVDYLSDALAFSSNRRILFVKLFQKIGKALGCDQLSEELVVKSLEHIHASATIIDDMLDNESLRKEIPTYYIRHGHPVAAFAALNLMMKGIELVCEDVRDMNKMLKILRRASFNTFPVWNDRGAKASNY